MLCAKSPTLLGTPNTLCGVGNRLYISGCLEPNRRRTEARSRKATENVLRSSSYEESARTVASDWIGVLPVCVDDLSGRWRACADLRTLLQHRWDLCSDYRYAMAVGKCSSTGTRQIGSYASAEEDEMFLISRVASVSRLASGDVSSTIAPKF